MVLPQLDKLLGASVRRHLILFDEIFSFISGIGMGIMDFLPVVPRVIAPAVAHFADKRFL